ncbi:23S rRNA (guanosine(2251)-2'-O)-methyltransferase RlmB [Hymenobacter sp. BT770]|uniref:23S rRNA (guanosine(2251)-2'-O)-methyltransferase RlmB n=1 Tax=Hymenobacter sp. BT770 TaxID=2886942 RepID=UPI001D113E0F|nr:23S rRNA (guanosine(2251)-2'-O)-methyltransferase RlmB [Hymenobacter sp. BT770]MCC3153318.1 23S rRNA (guanosine(2251)-2'-O)-methyltransferase RlmB [Hymenobacter sp. BT770]MDO3414313.1 23S rRNA (guanosine(2251)-2'-O)-methyltransferase RlmB [Hymenobacter sp. BT770]
MENPTDRPDRPERPNRPVAGRRFYDGANRPVTPKQFRPDRGGSEFDDRPARPRGRGGSDNRDEAAGDRTGRSDRGESRPPFRERNGEGSNDRPRYENRPAADRSIDMLFGLRPILEALSAGRTLEKIFLLRGTKNSLVADISAAARAAGIPVQLVPSEKLDGLTRKNHQGAVAFVSPIDYAPLDSIVSGLFEEGKVPFLLLLDRITDVRNFGAIARTAECLGVQAIVVPGRGAAQINGDALKTSAGALNILPVCRENNLQETIKFLQQSGVTVVACTEKADEAVGSAEVDFTGPVAVLMGSEEDGISPELLRLADVKLKVPMAGQIQSLNVSVAAGIMLFEVARQRVNAA